MPAFRLTEVVRTLELEPIRIGAGDHLRLRVEILRHGPRSFSARVWRLEHHRIQPTFPQRNGRPHHRPSDEEILVVDDMFARDLRAPSAAAVLRKIQSLTHSTVIGLF